MSPPIGLRCEAEGKRMETGKRKVTKHPQSSNLPCRPRAAGLWSWPPAWRWRRGAPRSRAPALGHWHSRPGSVLPPLPGALPTPGPRTTARHPTSTVAGVPLCPGNQAKGFSTLHIMEYNYNAFNCLQNNEISVDIN